MHATAPRFGECYRRGQITGLVYQGVCRSVDFSLAQKPSGYPFSWLVTLERKPEPKKRRGYH